MNSVFLTGHTGFKGAWFIALLAQQGLEIHGFSDEARPDSLFRRGGFSALMNSEVYADIRELDQLKSAIRKSKANLVVHFAAQPIVLRGYTNAMETFDVNINGTLNALEASLQAGCERVLIITTDKVYKDLGKFSAYSEQDPLQGWDPYSASKAAADIATQSWLELYRDVMRVDIARGGNVIAGGDDSEFRLVPDIERAVLTGESVKLRNSTQVRPWQHALDCLSGYVAIATSAKGAQNTWNIGPKSDDEKFTAGQFAKKYLRARGSAIGIVESPSALKETAFLSLDSSLAFSELGWSPTWGSQEAITMTAEWYSRVELGEHPKSVTLSQVGHYIAAGSR